MSRLKILAADTLGEAWIDVAELILTHGVAGSFGGLPHIEIELVTLEIARPEPEDALIEKFADADWLAWMRRNFVDHACVAELGAARSYASRLFDYGGAGRDQIARVIETLKHDPAASYAAITTFEPLTDTTYIPCVSLMDFWLRSGRLDLVVYCHSIDFGKKGYGNLVELAELQRHVALKLEKSVGRLTMIVKTAHIYETERGMMGEVVRAARAEANSK